MSTPEGLAGTPGLEQPLIEILGAVRDPILITGDKGEVVHLNAAFEGWSGLRLEAAAGRPVSSLREELEGRLLGGPVWAALTGGRPFRGRISGRGPDDRVQELHVEVTARARAPGVVLVLRDVRDSAELHSHVEASFRAEAASRIARDVMADLRLTLHEAARSAPGSPPSEAVELATKVATQLEAVVCRPPERACVVNLERLVLDSARAMQRTLGPQISLQTDLAATLPDVVVEESAVAHLLLGLATDARENLGASGTLRLATREASAQCPLCLARPGGPPFVQLVAVYAAAPPAGASAPSPRAAELEGSALGLRVGGHRDVGHGGAGLSGVPGTLCGSGAVPRRGGGRADRRGAAEPDAGRGHRSAPGDGRTPLGSRRDRADHGSRALRGGARLERPRPRG